MTNILIAYSFLVITIVWNFVFSGRQILYSLDKMIHWNKLKKNQLHNKKDLYFKVKASIDQIESQYLQILWTSNYLQSKESRRFNALICKLLITLERKRADGFSFYRLPPSVHGRRFTADLKSMRVTMPLPKPATTISFSLFQLTW